MIEQITAFDKLTPPT